jgi:hypothetical protein
MRIDERNFKENPTYFKYLIKEVVEERRKQSVEGFLYEIDTPEFIEEDY